jgi:uncharacterized protein YfcZ (UPF0381/DUF406 family)
MSIDERLRKAIAARDKLAGDIQRISGKKQAAEQALEEVEQEIRDANLDPETLGETLRKLEQGLETSIREFEIKLQKANESLKPYME